jgi:hypothetical protein
LQFAWLSVVVLIIVLITTIFVIYNPAILSSSTNKSEIGIATIVVFIILRGIGAILCVSILSVFGIFVWYVIFFFQILISVFTFKLAKLMKTPKSHQIV